MKNILIEALAASLILAGGFVFSQYSWAEHALKAGFTWTDVLHEALYFAPIPTLVAFVACAVMALHFERR